MKSSLNFIKQLFRIGSKPQSLNCSNIPTKIVDGLVQELQNSIRKWTIGDSTLLFSTAYVVYLPSMFYKDIWPVYGLITKDASNKFNNLLERYLKQNPSLSYYPFSKNWGFVLNELSEGQSDIPDPDNKEDIVSYDEVIKKQMVIKSYPTDEARKPLLNFSFREETPEGTIRNHRNSTRDKAMILCIGDVKQNLSDGGDGFVWPINFVKKESIISNEQHGKTAVKIEICTDGINFVGSSKASMSEIALSRFYIGGMNSEDIYNGLPVIKINSDKVFCPHFEVRVDSNIINIRALALTTLCGKNITPKVDEWTQLPIENAFLHLNNEVELQLSLVRF